MNMDLLVKQLIVDEACRLQPYRDSLGFLTIGVGRCLDKVGLSSEEAVWFFQADLKRVWRGLQDGITQAEADLLLKNDIAREWEACRARFPWVDQLDEVRQNVMANMAFNLGVEPPGHLPEFVTFLAAVQQGRYLDASVAMLHTLWARQVGARATRLSEAMKTGPGPKEVA
jgi:lysozyme